MGAFSFGRSGENLEVRQVRRRKREMEQAKALTAAIEEIVKARKQNTNVTAIWAKLDRVANYLNEQLAAEFAS